MSSNSKTGLQTAQAVFGSAGLGTVVGKLTTPGLGFAFGGIGLVLGGILMFTQDMDDVGLLIGLAMVAAGIVCIFFGLAHA